MALSPNQLRVELRRAGIANAAIDAAWPQWWSSDAESSLSATAELTFTVARRLGLAPRELLDGEARFVWRDETKFKHLTADASEEEAALSSFGAAVARAALQGAGSEGLGEPLTALELRGAVLASGQFVDALGLLSLTWGIGIPVLHLRVLPLEQKRMHAMSSAVDHRAAVLLGRSDSYFAPAAFTIAHELGHIMLGHLPGGETVVDVEDPFRSPDRDDDEEVAADAFALELLTGQPSPIILIEDQSFTATQLADAVMREGPGLGIEPGVLAMCAGHHTGRWEQAYGALKIIQGGAQDVPTAINSLARSQLDWDAMSMDSQDYLATVMGLPDV